MAEERQSPDSLGILRKFARWDILVALTVLSVALFAFPSEYQAQYPNIQRYAGIATAVFFIALAPCVAVKAFQEKKSNNDLSQAALVVTSVLLFIGVIALLGIAYEIALQEKVILPIVGIAVSASFMIVFYLHAMNSAQAASKRLKEMSANWLKFIMMVMASMVAMIMTVNYASQTIWGMDFFPMPDNFRAPLIAAFFVSACIAISKTERQIDKVMAYLN